MSLLVYTVKTGKKYSIVSLSSLKKNEFSSIRKENISSSSPTTTIPPKSKERPFR